MVDISIPTYQLTSSYDEYAECGTPLPRTPLSLPEPMVLVENSDGELSEQSKFELDSNSSEKNLSRYSFIDMPARRNQEDSLVIRDVYNVYNPQSDVVESCESSAVINNQEKEYDANNKDDNGSQNKQESRVINQPNLTDMKNDNPSALLILGKGICLRSSQEVPSRVRKCQPEQEHELPAAYSKIRTSATGSRYHSRIQVEKKITPRVSTVPSRNLRVHGNGSKSSVDSHRSSGFHSSSKSARMTQQQNASKKTSSTTSTSNATIAENYQPCPSSPSTVSQKPLSTRVALVEEAISSLSGEVRGLARLLELRKERVLNSPKRRLKGDGQPMSDTSTESRQAVRVVTVSREWEASSNRSPRKKDVLQEWWSTLMNLKQEAERKGFVSRALSSALSPPPPQKHLL